MQFKTVESILVDADTTTIRINGARLKEHDYFKFNLFMIGGGPLVNQPALRFNGDTGSNYVYNSISMDAGGGYNNQGDAADKLFLGPGFSSNGEQIITEGCIVKGASKTFVYAKTFTNGTNEGDIHFFDGHWSSAADVEYIDFLAFDTGLSADGEFRQNSRIEIMALGGRDH